MTAWQWGLLILGWLLFALWLYDLLPAQLIRDWDLPSRARSLPDPPHWPKLSVIVPARDEAASIQRNLLSLLASDYPNLEVIAVNDRSADRTGELMDEIADAKSRLKVVHILELPGDWLGKNHAMRRGADLAQGEWLLFTDGDVFFEPQALQLAVKYAQHHALDHLALMPHMIHGDFWENAMIQYFGMVFIAKLKPWRSGDPKATDFYAGLGAFNMVRRLAYQALGGHEPLKLEVIDDVKLGKLFKRNGFLQHVLFCERLVQVKWHTTIWGFVRGLEKNAFATIGYSLPRLIGVTAMILACTFLPYLVPLLAGLHPLSWGYLATLALVHGCYGRNAYREGVGWYISLALPVVTLVFLYTFWRSACITLRQQGIYWRNTFYSLELLRKNMYP